MKNFTEESMPYINRDVSWLAFNHRVLQEAIDPAVPLFDRIKFLAIYSSNLDEFFKVRVANLRNLVRVGKKTKKKLNFDPKRTLKKVLKIVNQQQTDFSRIFEEEILPELGTHKINLLLSADLNSEQSEFVDAYFHNNLLPFVQPVLLVKKRIRPFLNNGALYMACNLRQKEDENGERQYALVKVPSDHLPRFIKLPSSSNSHDFMMLDDIVRRSVHYLFPGYIVKDTFSIKLTRDAELYIDDEFSGDLLQKIRKSLNNRNIGPAARLVYDREMSDELLNFLMECFDLEEMDLLPEGRYHNNSDFFKFPDFEMNHLKQAPLPPLPYKSLEQSDNFFESIAQRDHINHVPFQSYESVVRFFEEAATNPDVTHIKIVQYRVAKKSRIMKALMAASQMGKQVSVFIEVKARFDEENNLDWGEKLAKAGVTVHYSFPGLKVHSKIALVTKVEKNQPKLYAYLSTGNFHEDTARVYSDLGLFTADKKLTNEIARVFSFLETVKVPGQNFKHLLVGQFNLREKLVDFIDKEIKNAKAGKAAKIILKMNSLQDHKMILKLYEASTAGVKIQLMIRGICCLIPGIKKVSENIEVRSIVDRYLEHSRIFIFHNNGNEKIYLSSADWMVRNLSYRIEVAFPLYDEAIRKEVLDFIDIQLKDNVKARLLDRKQLNEYYKNDSDIATSAQLETYFYLKRKE